MNKLVKIFSLIIIAKFLTGCAGFSTGRQFVEEMDEQNESFFVANRDFRVAAGDSSDGFRSKEEIQQRTPMSEEERSTMIASKRLNQEFQNLYQAQSDFARRHYHQYEGYLPSLSQKIYFLRLETLSERNQYLFSVNAPVQKNLSNMSYRRPANEVVLGMTKNDVVTVWGRPTRRDVAGNPAYGNERWAYFEGGRIKYVYFESGKVQGWSIPE